MTLHEASGSKRRANRDKILAALRNGDKCQSDLIAELGIGLATVSRWMEDILARKEAHVRRYKVLPNGGPVISVYRFGPAPAGFRAKRPKIKTDAERTRKSRAAMRRNGEWQDVLARRRADYWKKKAVKRDALTTALFGVSR